MSLTRKQSASPMATADIAAAAATSKDDLSIGAKKLCMALAGIRVRDEADGLGEVVEELCKDDVMVLLGEESDKWLKVQCSSGIQGWVLSANKISTMVQKVSV